MRVLLIAPYYDKNTPGESWSTFKWVEGVSRLCDVTVLTTHKPGWISSCSSVQASRVVNWTDPLLPSALRRLDFELKPGYVMFYARVARWLSKAAASGEHFDIVHQINPLALRYPSPASRTAFPYLVGPLAGSLSTPRGYEKFSTDRQWFRKLRHLDHLRIKFDPVLRASYSRAAALIGVAPYVKEILSDINLNRFEVMGETGVEQIASKTKKYPEGGAHLKILFVGRIIYTKGILDAIHAIAKLPRSIPVEFNVVGDGDLLPTCKREVERLSISHLVRFHGRQPRDEVTKWYQRSDMFLFPSYREPSGNVIFEAMSHGLPIIAANYGGPGYVVNASAGFSVTPTEPEQYSSDLASCILRLATDPALIPQLSAGAIKRITELAFWPDKIRRLINLYSEIAGAGARSQRLVL